MSDQTDSVIQITELVKDHHTPLSQRKSKVRVLNGLSLRVAAGEAFGLLGANGAGKSTTVKILLGLQKPTSGSCSVLSRPPGDGHALRKIGYLPENPQFYRHLSAVAVLDFYARLFEMPASQRKSRVEELLDLVSLSDCGSKPVASFSKGMVQRLALAQCLLNSPEVLFLDEPNSGLDPIGRRDMRDILLKLKEQGTTLFLNSHLLPDVNELCDRIAILHEGRLVAEDETQKITSSGDYRALEEYFMDKVGHAQSVGHSL